MNPQDYEQLEVKTNRTYL